MRLCKIATIFVLKYLIFLGVSEIRADSYQNEDRTPYGNEPNIPKVPRIPNCGDSFPGTSNWNVCWDKFNFEMRLFQYQMQQYSQKLNQMAARNPGNNNYYSSSSSSSSNSYTSSVMSNGYIIKTVGIPVSTQTRDSVMQIKLTVGDFDAFQSKIEGNEILIELKSGGGQRKFASIQVPEGVKVTDVKFERTSDSMLVIGPIKNSQVANLLNNNQGLPYPLMMKPYFEFTNVPQMWFF